jgi:hypothetical protein
MPVKNFINNFCNQIGVLSQDKMVSLQGYREAICELRNLPHVNTNKKDQRSNSVIAFLLFIAADLQKYMEYLTKKGIFLSVSNDSESLREKRSSFLKDFFVSGKVRKITGLYIPVRRLLCAGLQTGTRMFLG